MDLPPDFRDLSEAFARESVEAVLVGGYAVAFHARPRATKDANLDRAARALALFGAPANVVDAVRVLKEGEVAYLGQPPVRIDLLRTIEGVDLHGLFARAVVISLDDLIANKRAVGRRQDLLDAELLEAVRARGE